MAASGYKLFVTGDVLTAAQVNDYLMLQTVMVFANSAARTSALSGVLAEGLVSYLKDTDVVEVYTGAAWVSLDDPNAIQNSIVDAKGDLIAATADNTPARLAVGTDGQVLTASSGAATGLAWASASGGGSSQVAGKNAVINGDFLINQRAFTSNTTTGTYNFDRWLQQNSGGTFTVTPQTFTPGTAPIATYEGRTYVQGITASQSTAGHYAILTQRIEDVTRYAGTTVTISFFAKANTGTPKIGVELWQDYGTGGSPSTAGTVAQSSVTLTTSWARYSVSVAVPSLTGKTLGTTANTSYLELNLWTSAGSTYNTRASSIGIQNFTASIWGVQLEYASSATYFTTATGTLQGELAACQRYYQVLGGVANSFPLVGGYGVTGTVGYWPIMLSVPMRTSPTIVKNGTWVTSNCDQPSAFYTSFQGFSIKTVVTSTGGFFAATDTADDTFTLSGEL